jgi:hypothetical protein
VPGSRELGARLSPEVRASADAAAEIVWRRVADRGFAVRRRTGRHLEPDWWLHPSGTPGAQAAEARDGIAIGCPVDAGSDAG